MILRTQTLWDCTGLNPQGFKSAPWDVTFNTASSFMTNTNWQFYGGETTMTLLQPDGRADGAELAVGRRRHRGCDRADPRHRARSGKSLGNFWTDLVRTILYVLGPIVLIAAIVLVSQGAIQNLANYSLTTRSPA